MSTVTSFKPVLVQPQALADLFSAVQAQVHLAPGVALDDVRAELASWTLEEAQEKADKALNGDFYTPAE